MRRVLPEAWYTLTRARNVELECKDVDIGPAVKLPEQFDSTNLGAIFQPRSPFPISLAAPENFGQDRKYSRALLRLP